MNFIENKNYITISMETYLKELRNKLMNIIEYSNENEQIKRFSIDEEKLRNLLERISYPFVTPMMMAVATGHTNSVCEECNRFDYWFLAAKEFMNSQQLEYAAGAMELIFDYKGHLFSDEVPFSEENVDHVVAMAERYSSEFVQRLAQKIKTMIAKRTFQTQVLLNAKMPPAGFVVQEVDIIMGGDPVAVTLTYKGGLWPEIIRDDSSLDLCTKSVRRDYNTLHEMLTDKKKQRSGVLTAYMRVDTTHREKFEQIKRRLSLGLSEEVPSMWNLSPTLEGIMDSTYEEDLEDIWKIRVDESRIITLKEDEYGWASSDPTPVRWLERVK
jgi:hypothetical protein